MLGGIVHTESFFGDALDTVAISKIVPKNARSMLLVPMGVLAEAR